MIKVALLLLIVVAFVALVLSNFSPIALNILGITTQALPLGLWVVIAIGLGGLTTLLVTGLLRFGRSSSGATRPRRTATRSTDRTTASGFRAPWAGGNRQASGSTEASTYTSSRYTSSTTRTGDDWETSQQSRDDWNDWGETPDLTDRQTVASSNTQVRDTEDEAWANWDGYEDLDRGNRQPTDEFDEFEDEFVDRRRADNEAIPRRTDFEAKQEPEAQRQSGSVYSYSYRRADGSTSPLPPPPPPPPRPTPSPKPGEVYDAEYRLITPPYRPDPEEIQPPPPSATNPSRDDDDWGLDDDDEFDDRPNP